ncbi:peptidase M24, structural domain-containing protein [Daedaleopsis nitida]|nr:peptidase M24, structural domain-containing protein [Daedaleopsis nitida]
MSEPAKTEARSPRSRPRPRLHKIQARPLSVEGAKVLDLCVEGDKLLGRTGAVYNKASRVSRSARCVAPPLRIAFPTCVSVNNAVAHFSPLESDPTSGQTLAKGDVVKLHLGAHIDGFPAVSAETLVVGRREQNWTVTDAVNKVAAAFGCKASRVRMLSCQQAQNVIDGKKRIILNPSEEQKKGFEAVTFAENEVWGIDILITSAEDGKARMEESRTSVYQKESSVTYQLKMKTSRAVFSEVQKKAGAFPFNIRWLEDEKRARLGLQEAVQHGSFTPANTLVAAFHFTIALLPVVLWYKPELVKSEKSLEDPELQELLTKPLRENKKAKKKAEAAAKTE